MPTNWQIKCSTVKYVFCGFPYFLKKQNGNSLFMRISSKMNSICLKTIFIHFNGMLIDHVSKQCTISLLAINIWRKLDRNGIFQIIWSRFVIFLTIV